LDRPRPGEERYRELKLLVVHRDDLVDERRRCQQRLRWHLHQLDPSLVVPAGALDRAVWLDKVGRWLSRRTPEVQVRIARDLVGNRQLNCALHRIAITQARVHPAARAYISRKKTEGKSNREAIRCLKRQLVRTVFNTLKAGDALT